MLMKVFKVFYEFKISSAFPLSHHFDPMFERKLAILIGFINASPHERENFRLPAIALRRRGV